MAAIVGKVYLHGIAPQRKRISMAADPKCQQMHTDAPVFSETVLTNQDGTLQNVFVYVKNGLEDFKFLPPRTPVTLEQQGCIFRPHVLGMMTRQPLEIVNSDDTLHRIHAVTPINQGFNIGQPNRGMQTVRTFTKPEVMIRVKCEVHPWMSAYIGVLDHPYFSVTGTNGSFEINGLPAGNYVVEAWHEVYGVQSLELAVDGAQTNEIAFAFGD